MLILTYHSVRNGHPGNRFVTSPADFELQLKKVMESRKFMDLRSLDPGSLPEDGALLTFDDGYEDNFSVALPIALRLGIPMAVFTATNFIGRSMKLGGETLPCMSARQIGEMHGTGMVAFGSHTHNHLLLDEDLDPEAVRRDILESKRILSELIGYEADAFVYPKGRYKEALRHMLEESFRMAFRGAGIASRNGDRLQIPRVEVLGNDKWYIRNMKLSGMYYRLRSLRALVTSAAGR
jgi:peptidoglycan/xylan/chitin deacetylase (PgdA/CDA1 family)